jgi:hypothetical protein
MIEIFLKESGFYDIYEKLSDKEKIAIDKIKQQMEKSVSVFASGLAVSQNNKNQSEDKET